MTSKQSPDDILTEFKRLGLRLEDMPYQGIAESVDKGPGGGFLAHLKSLSPGCSWQAVFPDLPSDWKPGDLLEFPELPLGPFDYPEAPRGGAVTILLKVGVPAERVADIVSALGRRGIVVYGYGLVGVPPQRLAHVVFDRSVSYDGMSRTVDWLLDHELVEHLSINRPLPYDEAT